MVRQYRIHTDLDGSENKIYDMTNGLIRFYQPSDLGLVIGTNIWQSQGIGVLGSSNIVHPDIEFSFETFGESLEENYRIFNTFINDILAKRYVTLEYTNEIGTYYADVQMSKITKTEGYGFNGTFSESIAFTPITMWYVYEQLKFSKVNNGEINRKTKIHTGIDTTVSEDDEYSTGDNLLYNSTWDFGKLGWEEYPANVDVYEVVEPDVNDAVQSNIAHFKPASYVNQQAYLKHHSIRVNVGDTFAISFDYKNKGWVKNTKIMEVRVTSSPDNMTPIESLDITSTQLTPDFERVIQTFTATKSGYLVILPYSSETSLNYESWFRNIKVEIGEIATAWTPAIADIKKTRYTYDYSYYGEDDVERFSKWKIDDGIFSFTARVIPSKEMSTPPTPSGKNYYGVRFLDKDFNEYTAITFESNTKPESIQFNTDVNDEYYLAQIGTTTVNVFSALNYQRFRTRLIQKGTMELINVDVVEMNVKRKVEFV